MPLQETSGAASFDAFGGGAAAVPVYIEDVFSTYLYTGNGSTQTITNGIDLSGKGGLVWFKRRNSSISHALYDTARGAGYILASNTTTESITGGSGISGLSSFNSNGFSLDSDSFSARTNANGDTYVSWTFREQPKFFDVVTYTGNASSRTIAHNLGSVPGTIIVKCTSEANDWVVYHRSLSTPASSYLKLNTSDAVITGNTNIWNNTAPTSSVFSVGASGFTNNTGQTYVAYLFAHDAGGFGLSGTDNVISCGSFTTDGSGNASVSLGYEPQWIMIKNSAGAGSWQISDVMRGLTVDASSQLIANSSSAESTGAPLKINATGFSTIGANTFPSTTYIYIAIRRGPMKTPTSGTSVFGVTTNTDAVNSTNPLTTVPEAIDLLIDGARTSGVLYALPRLTQWNYLVTSSTAAEVSYPWSQPAQNKMQPSSGWFGAGTSQINWMFKRAPGFFDVVCYTGNSVAGRTVTHNLTVVPEMMIVKNRTDSQNWTVYAASEGNTKSCSLDGNGAFGTDSVWNNTTPTSSVFSLGTSIRVNNSSHTYVAYLFATVAGVSKVGSYTGTGTTQVINCGFTAGSRFVMIKRTDSTGDWYVWDSARGIVAGNDPYLLLNSAVPEVTNTDYVDTANSGFEISSTAPAAINANGGTFIFLAIA